MHIVGNYIFDPDRLILYKSDLDKEIISLINSSFKSCSNYEYVLSQINQIDAQNMRMKKIAINTIGIVPTFKCNLHCGYCGYSSTDYDANDLQISDVITFAKYTRTIGNVSINVSISSKAFENNPNIYESIFRTFTPISQVYGCYPEVNDYYIGDAHCDSIGCYKNFTLCDYNDARWLFWLIKDLEIHYVNALRCPVLHGSCLKINDTVILLIGDRWSGKTTLTHYLTMGKGAEYLGDDCIYIVGNSYVGFAMPLPMRHVPDGEDFGGSIAQTIDSDRITRTLYLPPIYANTYNSIDVVLFPKFNNKSNNMLKLINCSDAFKKIINNIRAHDDMKNIYLYVKDLAMNVTCYEIEYTCSAKAYKFLTNEVLV